MQTTLKNMTHQHQRILITPTIVLDGLEEYIEGNLLKERLQKILKNYEKEEYTKELLGYVSLIPTIFISRCLYHPKMSQPTKKLVAFLEETNLACLPLPYFLGLIKDQKAGRKIFPQSIQSIEMLEEVGTGCSFCLRKIDGMIKIYASEYVSEGLLNQTKRIAPSNIGLLVRENTVKNFFQQKEDFLKEIGDVPISELEDHLKRSGVVIEETPEERRKRLKNAIIKNP